MQNVQCSNVFLVRRTVFELNQTDRQTFEYSRLRVLIHEATLESRE